MKDGGTAVTMAESPAAGAADGNGTTPCVKCGACTAVCPVYQVTGRESLTARGKQHLLQALPPDATTDSDRFVDILSRCLLCGACTDTCSRDLDTPQRIVRARAALPGLANTTFINYLTRKTLGRPWLLSGLAIAGSTVGRLLNDTLPAESGLRLRLGLLAPTGRHRPPALDRQQPGANPASATITYFAGCLATHLRPEIRHATAYLLASLYGSAPLEPGGQTCCGMAAWAAGDLSEARRLAKKNITAFSRDDLPILTSCGSCYAHLCRYPDLFEGDPVWQLKAVAFAARLREFSTFYNDILDQAPNHPWTGGSDQLVFYHDPCHLRFGPHIVAPPRQLLQRLPKVTLAELPNGPRCCGQGGLFHLSHPQISRRIRNRLYEQFATLGATVVVTTCSSCLLQWQQMLIDNDSPAQAMHLAVFLAQRLTQPATR